MTVAWSFFLFVPAALVALVAFVVHLRGKKTINNTQDANSAYGRSSDPYNDSPVSSGFVALVAGVIAAVALTISCVQINGQNVAVASNFGEISERTYGPGVAVPGPFQRLIEYPGKSDELVVEVKNDEGKNTNVLAAFSNDKQKITTSIRVQYKVEQKNVLKANAAGKDHDALRSKVINPRTAEVARDVIGSNSADELIGAGSEVTEKFKSAISERLAEFGVTVIGVTLDGLQGDSKTQERREAAAQREADRRNAELDAATAAAERKAALTRAETEAQVNRTVGSSLTTALVCKQYYDKVGQALLEGKPLPVALPGCGTAPSGTSVAVSAPAPTEK